MKAMMRGRRAIGAVVIAAALLGGCGRNPRFAYVSPDYAASLVVEPQAPGGPKAGRRNEVYLEAALEPGKAWPERVPIGSFTGIWAPASIAWIDATTVNVCPLNGTAGVVRQASVAARKDGARRSYRVLVDCKRARRAAPLSAG
ncbi:MAG: hypothetical protein KKE02_19925 [Alphaproteobacteria bacterium]|nr:hypothetical protein [Alphaproteobacteria bacterium]MBU1514741.1 hypothetical protein [Alphaproteobacteria bacterium]MBU2093872.1 hypothetical protein [Alphaproteobacteria bacterium]MBU2153299.1 hypothetical protein [Alphaproteobacteria bacterium]MBU2309727.1 hypothetical protein [Alphaproteobacteria bacterium]